MHSKNTLCPYRAIPLADCKEVNKEHVIPIAIGGPNPFWVSSDCGENNRLGELIDGPLANDPVVRLLATSSTVESRSGAVSIEIPSILKSTGEAVRTTFRADGVDFRFEKPVIKDGDHYTVKGFGNDVNSTLKQVTRGLIRKGMKPIEMEHRSLSPEEKYIEGTFSADLDLIAKGMTKIAYLTSVSVFGDRAIESESGKIFRTAILSETQKCIENAGFMGVWWGEFPLGLPQSSQHEHLVGAGVIGSQIITIASLFGVFHMGFLTPLKGIELNEGDGEIIVIDLKKKEQQNAPFLRGLINRLRDQALDDSLSDPRLR